MTLENKTDDEAGERFISLIDDRKYKEARQYFADLKGEDRMKMMKDKKYEVYFKVLRMSSI